MARVLLALLGINLLVVLALAVLYPEPMLAPGRLIEAHAQISGDCFACHTPLFGATADKCTACHEPGRIGVLTTLGVPIERGKTAFHQELLEQDCMACHSDHVGIDAHRALHGFSHALLEPRARERCSGCHDKPDDRLHGGIENNCSACHSVKAWQPASFDHDRYFRLDRDHDVACKTCHVQGGFREYSCYGCHEHTPAKIRSEHLEEGIRDFENCVECHRSADEHEARRPGRERSRDGRDDD